MGAITLDQDPAIPADVCPAPMPAVPALDRSALPWLAGYTGLTLLVLLALSRSLRLPSGYGIEDFLGWTDGDVITAARAIWGGGNQPGWTAAVAYLLIDTAIFLPCCAVLLLGLFRSLREPLATGRFREGRLLCPLLGWPATALVAALVITDLLANYGGIRRLGAPIGLFGCAAGAALMMAMGLMTLIGLTPAVSLEAGCRRGALRMLRPTGPGNGPENGPGHGPWAIWRRARLEPRRRSRRPPRPRALIAGALATLVLPALAAAVVRAGWPPAGSDGNLPSPLASASVSMPFAFASEWHDGFAVATGVLLLASVLIWWFGTCVDVQSPTDGRPRSVPLHGEAVRLVVRSRYVLLILAVFGGLQLGLDQSRDVVLALADIRSDWPDPGRLGWRAVVLLLNMLAVVMFAYSCWLWTRLACLVGPKESGPAEVGDDEVSALASADATGPAPLLASLAAAIPLGIICVVVAFAVGDLTLATRRQASANAIDLSWALTVAALTAFALQTLAVGVCLLFCRHQYRFEAAANRFATTGGPLRRLLRLDTGPGERRPARPRGRPRVANRRRGLAMLGLLARPDCLPVVALLAMLALRAIQAFDPALAAQVPLGLAILMFALTWWLGVLGVLALHEHRLSTPLVLVPIAVTGLFAGIGWVDHHRLYPDQMPFADDPEAVLLALEQLRHDGFVVTLALTGVCLAGWALWVFEADPLRRAGHWLAGNHGHRWRGRRGRLARLCRGRSRYRRLVQTLLIAGLAIAVLAMLDRQGARASLATAGDATMPRRGETIDASALSEVGPEGITGPREAVAPIEAGARLPKTGEPVVLIAAEGGGMRSAYWTAKALARLAEGTPEFGKATFIMSGVSGGALGIAVFRACQLGSDARPSATGPPPTNGPIDGLAWPSTRQGTAREAPGTCVDRVMRGIDSLSPLLSGLVFEDVIGGWLPTALFCDRPGCGFLSRGLMFEREWLRMLPQLGRPLRQANADSTVLVFNSTWVESGNRTIATTLSAEALGPSPLPTGRLTSSVLAPGAPETGMAPPPRLMPSATRLQDCLDFDLSLITAAHTSARFPYINPLASISRSSRTAPARMGGTGNDANRATEPATAVDCKESGHLIDGGLFDNSGVTSILDLARRLRATAGPDRPIRAFLIRNGQSEPECLGKAADGRSPPADCFARSDEPRVDLSKLEKPLDQRRWNLYANGFGPLTALLNVSGIGAHGRQGPAQLRNALGARADSTLCWPVRLIEQIDAGELTPLGWYLSRQARQSLDAQLRSVFRSACLEPLMTTGASPSVLIVRDPGAEGPPLPVPLPLTSTPEPDPVEPITDLAR